MISVGAICYIVRVELANESMLGHVVTVIAPAVPIPQRGGALMHEIDAPWLQAAHPRTRVFAPPSALRRIAGPGQALPAPHRRIPAQA